jgi:hypothetical protein
MEIIESNIGYWELWEVLVADRGTQFEKWLDCGCSDALDRANNLLIGCI